MAYSFIETLRKVLDDGHEEILKEFKSREVKSPI